MSTVGFKQSIFEVNGFFGLVVSDPRASTSSGSRS